MDVNRNATTSVNHTPVDQTAGTSQPAANISHIANKSGFDLSSFYIPMNTPITFD
ncbi:hypothetical protein JOJ88_003008 [Pantoea cypripedii]|nr:hypothetical protein [Pantoea cypripedii]